MKTGKESATLKHLSIHLAKSHSKKDIFTTSIAELGAMDKFLMCTSCRAFVNVMAETFRSEDGELNGPNAETNSKMVVLELCDRFNIQTPEVCSGLVDLNWPIVHYIIMNSDADVLSLCSTLPISFCAVYENNYNWTIAADNSKGPLTSPKAEKPLKTDKDLTIVHLTDIHFDPEYQPGSLAECDEPMCCRTTAASDVSAAAKAGYWSDYRDCDTPLHLVENALDHIKTTYKTIDYIYQTGDIVPHNVWSTAKEGNKAMLTQINDLIAKKFPDIPVYPCVGNHEPHPSNM